jgi:hypothetical protein
MGTGSKKYMRVRSFGETSSKEGANQEIQLLFSKSNILPRYMLYNREIMGTIMYMLLDSLFPRSSIGRWSYHSAE